MKTTLTKGFNTGEEICLIASEYEVTHIYKSTKYSCGHISIKDELSLCILEYVDCYRSFEFEIYKVEHPHKTMICLAVVYHSEDCLCAKCEREVNRVYCDSLPKPVGFDSLTIYHGIAAYNDDDLDTVGDYFCRVSSILRNPHWQICCSTTPIGYIGIVVKGDILCASNADLFTEIDGDTGRRYFDKNRWRSSHIIYDSKDLNDFIWSHNEIVTNNSKATAVWVYSKAPKIIKQYGQFIAKILKVDYIEIEKALIA